MQKKLKLSLAQVEITHELGKRFRREDTPHDLEAEMSKLRCQSAISPQNILERVVEIALKLCRAQSAGLSVLEREADGDFFRWKAVTGQLSYAAGSAMPREFSPCGMVLDTNIPMLFAYPEFYFVYPGPVTPSMREVLVVPFHNSHGVAVGTVWIVAHHVHRRFDAHDVQMLTELTRFVSSAYSVLTLLGCVQDLKAQTQHERDDGVLQLL